MSRHGSPIFYTKGERADSRKDEVIRLGENNKAGKIGVLLVTGGYILTEIQEGVR